MRSRSLFLVAAALVAAAFFYIWGRSGPAGEPGTTGDGTPGAVQRPEGGATDSSPGTREPNPGPGNDIRGAGPARAGILAELAEPVLPPPGSDNKAEKEWIEDRVGYLDGLSSAKDHESMIVLLSELTNPRKKISTEAVKSLRFMRNRDAVPYLEALVVELDGGGLDREIEDLIDYLKKETLTERRARKAREAAQAGEEPVVQGGD